MSDLAAAELQQGRYQRRSISNKCQSVRVGILLGIVSTYIVFEFEEPDEIRGILFVYTSWVFLVAMSKLFISWFFYRNPARSAVNRDSATPPSSSLVTVLIPVYNQEMLIKEVVRAVFESDYKNIEVIAINDGSTDHTRRALMGLKKRYPRLKVVNKQNGGKRSAVAKGFYMSHGDYIVMIDSDSLVDRSAISEFMKAFSEDSRLGAVAGEVRVLNSSTNFLTKCQCAGYDYAFNIVKRSESFFGTVMCCCGCLAAYRREAIASFIRHWNRDETTGNNACDGPERSDNGQPMPHVKRIESIASHDDCEDSALTVYSLLTWSTRYISSAIGYTEVPDSMKGYFRQQIRWTKGSLRTQIFASQFMWKRNKLMAIIFYSGLTNLIVSPILTIVVVFMGVTSEDFWVFLGLGVGGALFGLLYGIDAKLRYPVSRFWRYSIPSYFLMAIIVTLTLVPAALNYRKDAWMTR